MKNDTIGETRSRLLEGVLVSLDRGDDQKIAQAAIILLEWLCEPQNNTDENCIVVDNSIGLALPRIHQLRISQDLKLIFDDIGSILHDTHRSPDVATNFESTPSQLLARLREFLRKARCASRQQSPSGSPG